MEHPELSLHQVLLFHVEDSEQSYCAGLVDIDGSGLWFDTYCQPGEVKGLGPGQFVRLAGLDGETPFEAYGRISEVDPAPTLRFLIPLPHGFVTGKKRLFHRVSHSTTVRISVPPPMVTPPTTPLPPNTAEALSLDLSAGGLSIQTNQRLAKGTFLELELTLKATEGQAERQLVALGAVRSVDQNGAACVAGVEFSRISGADYERLLAYLFDVQRKRAAEGSTR